MPYLQFILLLVLLCLSCGSVASRPPRAISEAEPGAATVSGPRQALRAEDVMFSLRGSEDEFRKCFMRAMDQRGLIETRFDIGERGEVTNAEVLRSTLSRSDVDACIVERLLAHGFGPQEGPKSGRWTFVFRLVDPIAQKDFDYRLKQAKQKRPRDGVALDPSSQGSLDINAVEQRIEVKYPLFARCYRASIGRRGRAEGILRLGLEIDPSGHVSQVEDRGSVMPDPYAVDCVAEGFYAMEFPAPTGGPVGVHYRLDFE